MIIFREMGVREDFSNLCKKLRKRTKTKLVSVQQAGKGLDPALSIDDSTVSSYEKGTLPTFPKLLTLARAYEVPVGTFYEVIGANKKEICDCHAVVPKGKERELVKQFLEIIREKDNRAKLLIGLLDEISDSPSRS